MQRAFDRLLGLTGCDAPPVSASKLLSVGRFLLVMIAVEMWESMAYWAAGPHAALHLVKGVAMTAVCLAGWSARTNRIACVAAAALAALELVAGFPRSANHHYLVVLCAGLVALPDRGRAPERDLALSALRWLAVLGLVWAGLQKVLHGYYLRGEFFAYAIARNERFAGFFAPIVSDAELARLRALPLAPGAGPFRVDEPLFLLVSNLAWIGELVLPCLLLVRRTRPFAIAATLVYIASIELAAREIFFGGLIVNLVLLFAARDLNRRALPWLIGLYLVALGSLVGWLPRWTFT